MDIFKQSTLKGPRPVVVWLAVVFYTAVSRNVVIVSSRYWNRNFAGKVIMCYKIKQI